MKVLIIGANGFLGHKLVRIFEKTEEVVAADAVVEVFPFELPVLKLDITDKDAVLRVISEYKPDLTILTAAMTNVDACEDFPDRAYAINALGPKYVAEAVKGFGGRLIHISTDFVFDGLKGNYSESDEPNPISVYGRTKLQGEQYVLESGVSASICRTSVLYGWPDAGQRDNFFSWAYKSLLAGKTLKIIDGQITTPTLVDDLAECLYWMRKFDFGGLTDVSMEEETEIFHTAGPEAVSRLEFVQKIFSEMQMESLEGVGRIERMTELKQKARRPQNSSLNTEKIRRAWGKDGGFRSVKEAMQFLYKNRPNLEKI